jgi:hypothetical protein
MKYKFEIPKAFIYTFLALLLLSGCGWLENDGIKYQQRIVGNLCLLKYKNTDPIDLAHNGGNDMYSIVISDCRSVFYDSLEHRIYVETLRFPESSSSYYYRLILKDPSSQEAWQALEKHEVHEATFKKCAGRESCVQVKLR